jgi:DNA-binding XRE family transcriptional regulator
MRTNHLREIRESLMISKTELARKANISSITLTRIEQGKPSRMETKRRIVIALEHNFLHRRLGIDRRQFSYTKHIPERRTVKDRRGSME